MEGAAAGPTFSIIIPTFERRDVVLASVAALARQSFAGSFEVIVVVDGSTDGSAEALQALDPPFPLRVIEQSNQGVAAARNRGAEAAAGSILLFLDDDMEPDPEMLAEHAKSHERGADAVLGHLPLHPDSPRNFLTRAIAAWSDARPSAIAAAGKLGLFELLAGHLSIKRAVFERLGGFDLAFTRDGSYGDEDLDFGWRLLKGGYRVDFNPRAISPQRYVVPFAQHLRQWREAGRANVALTRKHPELTKTLRALQNASAPRIRFALRPLASTPLVGAAATRLGHALATAIAERLPDSRLARRLFFYARELGYWRGVAEAGGMRTGRVLRVLAYHAVSKVAGSGGMADYVIDPGSFAAQLDLLRRRRFHFVTAEQALAFLSGDGALPPRAILVTFDDGYADFPELVVPMLKERRIPAVVFVVTARLGASNEWDRGIEPNERKLMDSAALSRLAEADIEVGAHSRTHRALTGLDQAELADEVDGSLADLDALSCNRLRLFCYPYGAIDERAEERARLAGAGAAFTVAPGLARSGGNVMRVPRIEILRRDSGLGFLRKVATGGRRGPTLAGLARRIAGRPRPAA